MISDEDSKGLFSPDAAVFTNQYFFGWRGDFKLFAVLIIDDEKMILDMVKQALNRYNYHVETAQCAEEGLNKFNTGAFDAIITDVCMPDFDRISLLNRIRDSKNGKIPVIGISGMPWMLKNNAFDLLLHKPFSIRLLVESLEMLLVDVAPGFHQQEAVSC